VGRYPYVARQSPHARPASDRRGTDGDPSIAKGGASEACARFARSRRLFATTAPAKAQHSRGLLRRGEGRSGNGPDANPPAVAGAEDVLKPTCRGHWRGEPTQPFGTVHLTVPTAPSSARPEPRRPAPARDRRASGGLDGLHHVPLPDTLKPPGIVVADCR